MRKKVLLYTLLLCVPVWMLLSFIDVISHNSTDYDYARWNLFSIMSPPEPIEVELETEPYEPLSEKLTDDTIERYVKQEKELIEADMQAVEKLEKEPSLLYGDSVEEIPTYTVEDLDILARVINGEAGAAYVADETRYYVGSVVLNRVKSPYYPDNIHDVVFQYYQYSCTWEGGRYYEEPPEYCYVIARDLLENGSKLPDNVLLQANFVQGDGIYAYMDTIYFCTWR